MVLPITALARLVVMSAAVAPRVAAGLGIRWWRAVDFVAHNVDGDRVGEALDGGRLGRVASGGDLNHLQDGATADGGWVAGAGVKPVGRHVCPGARAGVETLDPAAVVEQMLNSGEVPGLGRDPTERQLNLVVERAEASVRKLAPWPE
jgi:hypothetical protein